MGVRVGIISNTALTLTFCKAKVVSIRPSPLREGKDKAGRSFEAEMWALTENPFSLRRRAKLGKESVLVVGMRECG